MILIRQGFAPAEVRRFSLPKLRLWTLLAEEAEYNAALVQAMAVWNGEKIVEMRNNLKSEFRHKNEPVEDWQPPTLERLKQKMASANSAN